jgi:hypothetical protein
MRSECLNSNCTLHLRIAVNHRKRRYEKTSTLNLPQTRLLQAPMRQTLRDGAGYLPGRLSTGVTSRTASCPGPRLNATCETNYPSRQRHLVERACLRWWRIVVSKPKECSERSIYEISILSLGTSRTRRVRKDGDSRFPQCHFWVVCQHCLASQDSWHTSGWDSQRSALRSLRILSVSSEQRRSSAGSSTPTQEFGTRSTIKIMKCPPKPAC